MDGTIALGQDAELAINVVGPFHENSGNESIIRNQSMGKAEMIVLLPEDRDLLEDLTMFLKTERYLKTSGMGQVDDSVRSIHREKGDINQNRRRQLRARVENLLKESKIIVSNRELDLSGDGTTKLERGFQELIRATYPQLNMLAGHPDYQETDLQRYLMDDFSDLFGGQTSALTEAELEIQNFLRQRFNRGESNHFKDLIQEFTTKPYGWPLPAVQCLLAQLYRKGRVEVRFEGTSLDERMLLQKLPQSNQVNVLALHVLEEIDPQKLNRFKSFHQDFFRSANPGTDYRNVIREFRTSLDQMIHDYDQLYLQQSVHPFLSSLGPSIELLKELKNKDDSSYLEDLETLESDIWTF